MKHLSCVPAFVAASGTEAGARVGEMLDAYASLAVAVCTATAGRSTPPLGAARAGAAPGAAPAAATLPPAALCRMAASYSVTLQRLYAHARWARNDSPAAALTAVYAGLSAVGGAGALLGDHARVADFFATTLLLLTGDPAAALRALHGMLRGGGGEAASAHVLWPAAALWRSDAAAVGAAAAAAAAAGSGTSALSSATPVTLVVAQAVEYVLSFSAPTVRPALVQWLLCVCVCVLHVAGSLLCVCSF